MNPEEAERLAALHAGDLLWAARANGDNFDLALDAWRSALARAPQDPEALARLARAEWSLGQRAADGARAHFEAGQEIGWRCLLGWPAFEALLDGAGYRVTDEAVAALPDAAAPCATWVVANGLSAVEARGPGARLDLEQLAPLVRWLSASPGRGEPGFAPWSAARLATLSAAPDPAPAGARADYRAAVAAAPDIRLFRDQLAAAFPDARETAYDGFAPGPSSAWALENAAWSQR